jgi:D-alanyl-D-alanine carboxypeptidase
MPSLHRTSRVATCLFAAAALMSAICVPAEAAVDRAAVQRQVDRVLRTGAPGVVAGVRERRSGKVRRYRLRAGVADLRTRSPLSPDARFRIASVSKPFLAAVVLQLAEEHRLAVDDALSHHLPGILPRLDGDAITLRMLLDHSSGVPDPTDRLIRHPERFGEGTVTPGRFVAQAAGLEPTHAPGARFSYSNTDYALLAMVVERITGAPYTDALRRRIVQPLGLRGTVLPSAATGLPAPALHGYTRRGGGPLRDSTAFNASWGGPAGGIVSTTADLNRFAAALADGRLLSAASFHQMRGNAFEARNRYGLGLRRWRTSCGQVVYGHDGGLIGYASRLVTTVDGRRQVSVGVGTDETEAVDAEIDKVVDAAICSRR